jgi:putative endonuclease
MFIVYMVECADKTFYIGSTNNLEKRLKQHNGTSSGARYTKMRRPVILVYQETCETYLLARRREAELKRLSRDKKKQLLYTSPI